MSKILLYLMIILLYINYLYCIVVLPIDTLPRENYKLLYNINSPKDIMDEENRKIFFTTFEIGDPVQKVPLLIKPKTDYYLITSVFPVKNAAVNDNFKNFNFSDNFFTEYDFYNENKSNSYILNWCRESEYYEAEEYCSANDTILIYEDINMKNKNLKNINFALMRNVVDNITGEIGLNLYDEVGRFYNTFLGILKANNLIKDYNWYFDFNSNKDEKGKLIIGSLPHEDYPNLYSEDEILFTKSSQLNRHTYMEMTFDDVYIINDKEKIYFSEKAELRYDTNIFVGDRKYEKYLLNQIDYLLKENKCFNDSIRDFDYYYNFTFYYCLNEKEIKDKIYKIITPIYFCSNDFNNTFEIKNNDIIFEKGNYIYIGMIFYDIISKWSLGKIFTLKHKFVFNQDNKVIGFYKKLEKGKNEKKNSKDYKLLIIIIIVIVLSIILVTIGIIIGKLLYKARKKRANELCDIYDYSSKEDRENECTLTFY